MFWMLMVALVGLLATLGEAGVGAVDPAGVEAGPSTLDRATEFLRSVQGPGAGEAGPNENPAPGEIGAGLEPPGPVAYDQFQEAVRAREQLEQQLGQFSPYAPLIEQLSAAGLTAEQTLQYLHGLAAGGGQPDVNGYGTGQQQVEQQYAAWLQQNGVDPNYLDPTQNVVLWNQFQQHLMMADLRSQHEAAERASVQAELTSQMQAVQQQFPLFQNPTLERALYAQFAFDAERGLSLQQSATHLARELQGLLQSQITEYAAHKQRDGSVPVVAGGAAPSPVAAQQDINRMSDLERRNHVRSFLAATSPGGL